MTFTRAYVFDAYGTLFDVMSATARLKSQVGPEADRLGQLWRTKQLEYTWTRSLGQRHRDFLAVTGDALDWAATMVGGLQSGVREKLMAAYQTLDQEHPEAELKPSEQARLDFARKAVAKNA